MDGNYRTSLQPWDVIRLDDENEPVILVPYSIYKTLKDDSEHWVEVIRKENTNGSY